MKTVSAGIIIINSKNQILGCKPFGKKDNRLDIPKGHIEDGETPYQAAIRETFEETGILIDESTVEEVFSDVCLGEVNYETKCFETKYNGKAPLQLESGIIPKWGSISELIENSPFKEYNKKLLEAVN